MKFFKLTICFLSFLLLMFSSLCVADDGKAENKFEIVSEFTYPLAPSDLKDVYESLCLFGAKYKAVKLSGKYLQHIGVLKDYGKRKREIFYLVADDLKIQIIQKNIIDSKKFYAKIKAEVTPANFIKAEIINNRLEEKERKFSWQEEMEQYLYKTINPGQEISRAYRYFRKKNWRIGMIYLDHLQKKYPNWQEIYFAKAIGFYAQNRFKEMTNALKKSCSLGNDEACDDLKSLSEHSSKFNPN